MNSTLSLKKKSLGIKKEQSKLVGIRKAIKHQWQFYVIILLPLVYLIVFHYVPMYGVLMAFKQYKISLGVWGSEWVGLKHFEQFFASPSSMRVIKNTLQISIYSLIAGFPIPIILAVALNEVRSKRFKKTVQMVTYAPYFISSVIMVGLVLQFLDPHTGLINKIIEMFGGEAVNFMAKPEWFSSIYVWSGVWQGTGYSAIIYLAALSGVDKSLEEAAQIDGASIFQRVWYVSLPTIRPTIIILLIMAIGSVMNVGFEKILLMQNEINKSSAEVIQTYVYKVGLVNMNYSFSTAVGLFNSVISLIMLSSANFIAKKLNDTSLW